MSGIKRMYISVIYRIGQKRVFVCFALTLFVIRLWSLSGMPIWALTYAFHDDRMMIDIAHQIVPGPAYDQYTLVKGWAFPFFLRILHMLRIPYIQGVMALYAVACLMAMFALSDKKMRAFHYAAYTALLFNPSMSSTDVLMRVYRNGLSAITAFMVIISMIAIYCRRYASMRAWFPWIAIAGIALPIFWYTREDSIWLVPFMLGVCCVAFVSCLLAGRKKRAIALLAALLVPVLTLQGVTEGIRWHRKAVYGVGITNELSEGAFPRVIKAIYATDFGGGGTVCGCLKGKAPPALCVQSDTGEYRAQFRSKAGRMGTIWA